ncbi:MAG: guanylate kinase [Deltaproteobacteria bacterium]
MGAIKGHLFIISGPSGAGKSTIVDAVLKKRPQLRYSVSYTTRAPRRDEKDGVDYHFVSESAFFKMIDAGELAEWAEVHGHLYGTSAQFIEEARVGGQDVLLDIDVQGARRLLEKYPEAISVFVQTPSIAELEKRLIKRGLDSPEAVKRRLKNAKAELAHTHLYDHVLVNDDLGRTVSQLEAIIHEAYRDG